MKHLAAFLLLLTLGLQLSTSTLSAQSHRRARHFNPGHAGAAAVWDSRYQTGMADNDPVSTLTDRSGNGNNLAQATSGRRPVFKASDSAFGGQPVIQFTRASDHRLDGTPLAVGASGEETLMAVYSHATLPGGYQTILSNGRTDVNCMAIITANDNNRHIYVFTSGDSIGPAATTSTVAEVVRWDGTTRSMWLNADSQSITNATSSVPSTRSSNLFMGSDTYSSALNGKVAQAIQFPFAVSDSMRIRLTYCAIFSFKIAQ